MVLIKIYYLYPLRHRRNYSPVRKSAAREEARDDYRRMSLRMLDAAWRAPSPGPWMTSG